MVQGDGETGGYEIVKMYRGNTPPGRYRAEVTFSCI